MCWYILANTDKSNTHSVRTISRAHTFIESFHPRMIEVNAFRLVARTLGKVYVRTKSDGDEKGKSGGGKGGGKREKASPVNLDFVGTTITINDKSI